MHSASPAEEGASGHRDFARFQKLLEVLTIHVWLTDPSGCTSQLLLGKDPVLSSEEVPTTLRLEAIHPDDRQLVLEAITDAVASKKPFTITVRGRDTSGDWQHLRIESLPLFDDQGELVEWIGASTDVTREFKAEASLRREHERLEKQNHVLELIASGEPIGSVFNAILSFVESGTNDTICSIMTVENGFLIKGAAPRLDPDYWDSIDQVPIAPELGACGAAAFHGKVVITEDIEHHPNWRGHPELALHRELALRSGLRSCWSVPIFSGPSKRKDEARKVLGTLGIYRTKPGGPTEEDLETAARAVHLAAIAIQKHRDEQSLRESERRFRDLANAIPALIWTADPSGQPTYANHLLKETVGTEGIQDWHSVVHPEDRAVTVERYATSLKTQVPYSSEHRIFDNKSGTYRWFQARAIPVLGDSGQVTSWIGTASDIQELKETVYALSEERQRFEAIAESAPGAIYTLRAKPSGGFYFQYCAPSIERLLDCSIEELSVDASALHRKIHPDDRDNVIANIARSAQELVPAHSVYRLLHSQRGQIWIECSATPTLEPDGSVCLHGFVTEITERKLMEEELLHSQKMEAVGRLAGGVAHDFNNLLTVIIGSAELLIEQLSNSGEVKQHLTAIRDASLRAAGLTKQLLSFSRRQQLLPKVVNPNEVVQHAEVLLRRIVGKKVQLLLKLDDDVKHIKFDPMQLEQILFNLVVNSSDAMPDGGSITISTSTALADLNGQGPQTFVKFCVADTGIGIDPDIRLQVFEPFFTTKPPGKGTGLGLSVVHGIVTQSGGKIEIESEVGRGTTMQFLIPATEEVPSADDLEAKSQLSVIGRERILVVDDEFEIAEIVRSTLQSQGYTVYVAQDVQSALDTIGRLKEPLDAIITDVVMGDGNGIDLAKALQQKFPALKVVLMSGFDSATQREGREEVKHVFLSKPFAPSQLATLVRELLDREP